MRAFISLLAVLVCAAADKPAPPRVVRVPVTSLEAIRAAEISAIVDNQQEARVLRIRTPKDELLLIVVLDLVGDIALVDPARRALVEQFANPSAKMQVALMRAQDGLQVLLDPSSDVSVLEKSVFAMPVTGRAGLFDTVETAIRLADAVARKGGVRVSLLYLTDSDIRNYREDFTNPVINSSDSRDLSRKFPEGLIREKISKIRQTLLSAETPLFVVHLRHANERLNEAYQSGLLELAAITGGSATFCRSNAEIPGAIAATIAQIVGQHHVTIQLPSKVPKMFNLTITSGETPLTYRSLFVLSK